MIKRSKIRLTVICLLWFLPYNYYTLAQKVPYSRNNSDDLNLSSLIIPTDTAHFFKEKNWYSWCNSLIKGEDGKYHLFYSRFPKSIGFNSWLVFSEIAHAVGDSLTGPFTYKETVLRGRGGNHWDAINAHNPKIKSFGNLFYLYYISTNRNHIEEEINDSILNEVGRTGFNHPLWMKIRNNQRSGVAVSSSINGPWQRLEKPIVEPSTPIKNVTVNPAVATSNDGHFYMIVKGDDVKESRYARMIQAVATSNSPKGPFSIINTPAFDNMPTEDASIWYDTKRKRFYAIFHTYGKSHIGLITSEDGIQWKKARYFDVCKKEIPLKDGSIMKVDRMERPAVYVVDGEVKVLSFAVKKGNESFIVFFNIKNESKYN